MTRSEIEPATFRFVAQHLNHCATAVPGYFGYYNYILPTALPGEISAISTVNWKNQISFSSTNVNMVLLHYENITKIA